MNKIRSGKILWTGRVLELGARKVPRLLAIGMALVSQQLAEQVAEPLRCIGGGALIKRHVEHTVGRGTVVFANGWGRSVQSERETMCRRGQWSSPWTIIEGDRVLLPGGDLLERGVWAAALAINIRHVVTNREGVSRTNPEDGRFDSGVGVADRSGTGDVDHIVSAPLVGPRNWDGLGGGLRGID